MNWDKEIEVESQSGKKAITTVGEIQGILLEELTKEEAEEFAGELIKVLGSPRPADFGSEGL